MFIASGLTVWLWGFIPGLLIGATALGLVAWRNQKTISNLKEAGKLMSK